MADRDPPRYTYRQNASGHSSAHPVNGSGVYNRSTPNHQLNPAAGQFQPSNTYNMSEVRHSSPYLEHKVNHLEREQDALRTEVEDLKTMCNSLLSSLNTLEKGGWDVKIGPFKGQSAAQFRNELDALSVEVKSDSYGANDHKKMNGAPSDVSNTSSSTPPHLRGKAAAEIKSASLPPHLRGKATTENKSASLPPHLRKDAINSNLAKEATANTKSSANNPLVTDGVVEAAGLTTKSHGTALTPPESPPDTLRPDDLAPSIEHLTLLPATDKDWTPHFLTTLPSLKPDVTDRIPDAKAMKSFSPDFLRNNFGGSQWSPGFNFIPPSPGPCILRNRSYYTLEAQLEPYLPSQPGGHGAKLVPFFNDCPEAQYDLPDDFGSTTDNVPLFVMRPDNLGRSRYFYFGHYSQTRWSDKLDYDRMMQCVPANVREYWAEELASAGRPEWISNALMNHFFPKPDYEGRMFGVSVDEGGSVMSADIDQREEKVRKEVTKYVANLRDWEKDARMKTAMIKKEFILQAFDRADADEPPALRLWWEYLECIDWKADFYNMLVTLQARDPNYERY